MTTTPETSFEYKLEGDSITITKFIGSETEVVIPAEIDGLPVRTIRYNAFEGCTALTSLTIPASVKEIGNTALYGCKSLKFISIVEENPCFRSIEGVVYTKDGRTLCVCPAGNGGHFTIPEGVEAIGEYAFAGSTGLTSVTIPEGVKTIGEGAFFGCVGLTGVWIPEGVKTIGEQAFYGCEGLTAVWIPGSVNTIGNGRMPWHWEEMLTSRPEEIEAIKDDAFYGCENLTIHAPAGSEAEMYAWGHKIPFRRNCATTPKTSFKYKVEGDSITITKFIGEETDVVIPTEIDGLPVRTIGEEALGGSYFRRSYDICGPRAVTIPGSVKTIGRAAFSCCTNLTSVTISEGVKTIGDCAFYGCEGLTSVTIPEGVETIGHCAFSGCTSLTSVTIPRSVETIATSAFCGCKGLTSIQVTEENPHYKSVDGVLYTKDGRTLCACPARKEGSCTIPEGVETIGWRAFEDCTGLTSVTIPESVKTIGGSAFEGCSGLTSVTIPDGVENIGERAFNGCSGLTSVTIPGSVKTIEYRAFGDCENLTIHAPAGSMAEKYAKKNRIPFVITDSI
ncbi:MAG: leucine-rich repeat domain-containing protein [Planctomycetia bacterium]|nr:leucine-rich repeat domain-containing protein [Planctomycetia bacterium]